MSNYIRNSNFSIFQNKFYETETGKAVSPIETQNYTIIQVTESLYMSGMEIAEHNQICDLEITLLLDGNMECEINDAKHRLEPKNLHIVFLDEKHSLLSKKYCRFQTLAINFKGKAKEILESIKAKYNTNRKAVVYDTLKLMSLIVSEFLNCGEPFFCENLDSLITSFLIKIIRNTEKEYKSVILEEDYLFNVVNYIDSNFLSIFSLKELQAFGYSYSLLSKRFKEKYGTTPKEYLIAKKMEYAVNLLNKGETVNSVSETLGYSNQFNFCRAFKAHFGYAPSLIKNQENND